MRPKTRGRGASLVLRPLDPRGERGRLRCRRSKTRRPEVRAGDEQPAAADGLSRVDVHRVEPRAELPAARSGAGPAIIQQRLRESDPRIELHADGQMARQDDLGARVPQHRQRSRCRTGRACFRRTSSGWKRTSRTRGSPMAGDISDSAPATRAPRRSPGTPCKRCIDCHTAHTAVERTFVQFYPTLFEVAKKMGTVKKDYTDP